MDSSNFSVFVKMNYKADEKQGHNSRVNFPVNKFHQKGRSKAFMKPFLKIFEEVLEKNQKQCEIWRFRSV